ncbi:uncharacterized protein LOC133883211 [Phragmites australis]|uniref:uncharacterized protein LOC133883211 n=1 Tax=Phragmites australis TaxID=29695 RepID=UPI002D78B3FD|nr:uncharacterized protein LOC133883211 [Phragmites australis]
MATQEESRTPGAEKGSTRGVAPYETMLSSTAYERMRAEHPAEFAPARVFFTRDARSAIDRRNSFRVKAMLVYEAVTGHDVCGELSRVNRLLQVLAEACHSVIHGSQTNSDGSQTNSDELQEHHGNLHVEPENEQENEGEDGSANPADTNAVEEKSELIDEGWDDKHKRVVDGIFLVVGFLPRLMEAIRKSVDREGVDESIKSGHMHDIVTDVIKLENQLSLKDLLDVAGVVEGLINETVGRNEFKGVKDSMIREYKLPFTKDAFGDVIHRFCWYYSPFFSKKPPAPPNGNGPFKGVATDDKMATRTLLDCLHQSVVPAPGTGARATGRPSRMPATRELRRSGVRFQASENGHAEVEFKEQTLRLPVLAYDFKLATVARNLLAREYEEQSKPLTRYFQMMNELVEDAADVRVLRRAGVVRGGSRGAREVHELIKNIDGHATYPSVYMAMDREIEKVRQHHNKRMKNFFVRNRPGVIWASSVAAVSAVAIAVARRNRR